MAAPDPVDVEVTHPERVLFPADGITKGDVVAYYRDAAPRMLPHLEGRPLSLQRFRGDVTAGGGFFQQRASGHFPPWVPRLEVPRSDGTPVEHPGADSAAALVYLANQGTLSFHRWPARLPDLERPDLLVLDLDPDGDDFEPVRHAAFVVRDVLAELGLVGAPMLTGSRGVHVHVAPEGAEGWEELWALAKRVGAAVVTAGDGRLTRAFYKSQRRGRLYVDTARARRGALAIAPWTVRPLPGAPVAVPVTWAELEDPALHARSFTLRDALERPA